MARKRKRLTPVKQKQLMQEAHSQCPFCQERDVSTFVFHHIDGDPSNDELTNLIVVCSSCHARIANGVVSKADVIIRKQQLHSDSQLKPREAGAAVNVNIASSSFHGDIAQNIIKISGSKAPRTAHSPGSIGANVRQKAYIDYLIARYFQYREADPSYGRQSRFSHAVIHRSILSTFGGKTFFLPEHVFAPLVDYLSEHIDKTIQGRRNQRKGVPNYHSFEEHCIKFGL